MEDNLKQQFYAQIENVGARGGSSGGVVGVRVSLMHKNGKLSRIVKGPIKEGDIIALMECEREERRIR